MNEKIMKERVETLERQVKQQGKEIDLLRKLMMSECEIVTKFMDIMAKWAHENCGENKQ